MLRFKTSILVSALVLSACPKDSSDPDVASAEEGSTMVESGAEVTYLSSYFTTADASLSQMNVQVAAGAALGALQASLSGDMSVPACVTVDTDSATYLNVTFDQCTGALGKVKLDGEIQATLSFETKACGPAQCPVAVIYDVHTEGLVVGRATLSGDWQVRRPLAGGASSWGGSHVTVWPKRTVSATSSATWEKSGACVTYSLDADIESSTGRGITVAADGVTRCEGGCPTAGTVTITGRSGATLSWSYDGEAAATVTGPNGNTFDVELVCAQ